MRLEIVVRACRLMTKVGKAVIEEVEVWAKEVSSEISRVSACVPVNAREKEIRDRVFSGFVGGHEMRVSSEDLGRYQFHGER